MAPSIKILLPDGITTSWSILGIPAGLQFVTTLKLPPDGPIQVFVCAEMVKQKMLKIEKKSNRFIIVGF